MKVFVLALCAVQLFTSVGSVNTNPLEKVLELLDSLLAKAKQGKHDETVQWSAFKQWCSDTEASKQEQVKAADEQIELLNANLLKEKTEAERLDREIVGHEADVVKWKNGTGDATKDRTDQHASYSTLHQDYSESVYAITEAIKVLKKQDSKRPQAAASMLAQIHSHGDVPAAVRRAVETFLMQDPEEPDLQFVAPPDAHGYEFQSGAVVDMLEKLLSKFKDEQLALEKQEMTDHHTYEMTALDLRNSIVAAEHEIAKKKEWSAGHQQVHAETTSQLSLVTGTRVADAKYLEDLDGTCNQKSVDFESRQKLRGEEIEAIEKAITILQANAVSGAADKHLPAALLQHGAAMVQIRSQGQPESDVQDRAATFLKGISARIGSHTLSALASQVQLNPFSKVKKLIEDLITRLKAQEAEEAQHKAWCDTELDTNGQTRTTKTEEVETLHNTIDVLSNRISVLEKEVSILSREVAEIAAEMAKAATLRAKDKAENEDTIADAVAAQMELAKAIKVLNDFYAGAAGAVAALQVSRGREGQPAIFDAPYIGEQNKKSSNNIIAFLDVIVSNFARLESETSGAEKQAAEDHESTQAQAKLDKASKESSITAKNKEKDEKSGDLITAKHNLELAQSQLEAALAYYDKLKPSCLITSTDSSHEERVQRRDSEVQALKEALSILSGETIPDGYAPDALYSGVDGGNFGSDVPTSAPA